MKRVRIVATIAYSFMPVIKQRGFKRGTFLTIKAYGAREVSPEQVLDLKAAGMPIVRRQNTVSLLKARSQ